MFTRRVLPVSVILALALALVASLSAVGAQEAGEPLGGSVRFRDGDAMSDTLVIALAGVTAPPVTTRYEGWLIAGDGSKISVGVLTVTPSGGINSTYVSPSGENLLATYGAFAISLEPSPDPDPATAGPIVFSDSVPSGAFVHVGHLVVAFAPNPDGKGIAVGLREQVQVALTHANLAKTSTTFATKQLHMHHVVNIIEGAGGANFDAGFGNPGDGAGVFSYAADAATHAGLARDAADDNESVTLNADGVIAASNNVVTNATRARDNALTVFGETEDSILVRLSIDNAIANLTKALNGTDADGDGIIGGVGAEGGAETAYRASQDIAEFIPISSGVVTPPAAGDSLVGTVAMSVLLAGLALTAAGVLLMRRRRSAAA